MTKFLQDLWQIYHWAFHEHGEAAVDEYYSAFFDRIEQLAEQPFLYQGCDDIRQGYRKCVCVVDTIYYRIIGNTVELMNVLCQHDRNEWL